MSSSDSTRQQEARVFLRSNWDTILRSVLPTALAEAQNNASADAVIAVVWPELRPEQLEALDRGDAAFLERVSEMPRGFREILIEMLTSKAEAAFGTSANPYARGTKLGRLIRGEVDHCWDQVRREVDSVFEAGETDRLGSATRVRELVLQRLSDCCLGAAQAAAADASHEADARRQLKALAALITQGGSRESRSLQLRGVKDASTASYPYVPKYLSRGRLPAIRSLRCGGEEITLAGFTPELIACFAEAAHVRGCLERFLGRDGVLMWLIDPAGPITGSMSVEFAQLPEMVPRQRGGVVMPKNSALELSRRDGLKMPDGAICSVSLATLIESALRQIVAVRGIGGAVNQRPAEMTRRIDDDLKLRPQTKALLDALFDARCLSPRDAMAHGAFFAGSEELVVENLAGLSSCLHLLLDDLRASGVYAQVFGTQRCDAAQTLGPDVLATFAAQEQPGLNLIDQLRNDDARSHIFKMLDRLVPDKARMGKAAFLLWINGQKLDHEGHPDETVGFAATLAGIITLEELFRAVYEVFGEHTLVVTPTDENTVKCELAVLDDRDGHLLTTAALRRVFGDRCDDAGFPPSMVAVRTLRDKILHGAWSAIPAPYGRYAHLLMKMVFTLCGLVDVAPKTTGPS